jgi:hypothetical protein
MVYVYQLVHCTIGQVVKRQHLIPEIRSRRQANTRRNYDEKSVTETVLSRFFVNLLYFREENLYFISLYKGITLSFVSECYQCYQNLVSVTDIYWNEWINERHNFNLTYAELSAVAFTATKIPKLLMRHRKVQNDMLLTRQSVEGIIPVDTKVWVYNTIYDNN